MKCEIKECNSKSYHKHHIISKSFGGSNKKDNICYLCANHHMDVHNKELIIEGRFLTTGGYKLIYHYNNQESITGMEMLDRVYCASL